MKKFGTILTVLILILAIVGIAFVGYGFYRKQTMEVKNPIVTMEVEDYGTVTIELYPDQAPNTVTNFIALINRGFYNGLTFHRVVNDFMIQGGDKSGDGTGAATLADLRDGGEDKDYCIKGEFMANGVQNTLKFDEGVLGMARSDYTSYSDGLVDESYNSESSQFFIVTPYNIGGERTNISSLNGYYTAFGKVKEGLEIIEKISEIEVKEKGDDVFTDDATESTGEVSTPVNPPVIKEMKVDTFGYDYGEPETVEAFDYMTWLYRQYGLDPSTLGQ